jgi:carboxylesterase type B
MKNSSLWDDYRLNFGIRGTKALFGISNTIDVTSSDIQNMLKLIEFYVGSLENVNENHAQDLIDMFTDSYFLFGTHKSIKYFQDQNMTVYQYILSYEYSNGNGFGVNHADDIPFLFNPPFDSDQLRYTSGINVSGGSFLAVTDHNHKT